MYQNHGARKPIFGVKIADLKRILKKTGRDHQLALELYATGNSDAMYLGGLMADQHQITASGLRQWVHGAYWYILSEFTVAGLTAESPHGMVHLCRHHRKAVLLTPGLARRYTPPNLE